MTAFAPNLKFTDTHANPDTECDKLTPDVGVYPTNDQPQDDAKTDFSKMHLFVEFKITVTFDPSNDPEDPLKPKEGDFCFENDSDNARLFRGQLASYATAHAGCQFSVHIFCVLVCGSMQGLFVGTVMERPLPSASTISKSPNFLTAAC